MKTNKIIILSTGGFMLMMLTMGLLMFRNDLKTLYKSKEWNHRKIVSLGQFDKLDLSNHWIVDIEQGKEYKVEITGFTSHTPKFENKAGTLFFSIDTPLQKDSAPNIHAKVTMPVVRSIKTVRGTKIHIKNFQAAADSLFVVLENGGAFSGENSHFKGVSIRLSGDAWLQYKNQ